MIKIIESKVDLLQYLSQDKINLGKTANRPKFFSDEIWKFQISLRHVEYYKNKHKKSYLDKLKLMYYRVRYKRLSMKLGFSIPLNVFGPGLSIAHRGTIVVNSGARIGENCRIHTCVNIGTEAGQKNKAPKLGDGIYIGPGVKIFGEIVIANNIAIGANSVVNKSFLTPNKTIGNIPAKVISDKGTEGLMKITK